MGDGVLELELSLQIRHGLLFDTLSLCFPHDYVVDKRLECLGESLFAAVLEFPVGQILMQLSDLDLKLSLLRSEYS